MSVQLLLVQSSISYQIIVALTLWLVGIELNLDALTGAINLLPNVTYQGQRVHLVRVGQEVQGVRLVH